MSYPDTDWIVGETPRIDALITDAAGTPIDAEDLVLKIKPPGAAIITIANPAHTADGTYHHDLPVDKDGTWYYHWEATIPFPVVADGSFTVQPSRFAGS